MTQKCLDRADIRAGFEKMGGEGMAEGVARSVFFDFAVV